MINRIGIQNLFFFVLLSLSDGCIEPFTPAATTTQFGYLVIDGFLINGTDSTIIKLSRTQTLTNEPTDLRELNATVQIEEENGITYTLTDNHDGRYSIAPLNLNFSKNYRLKIRTANAKEYSSDFVPVKKSPPLDKVTWIKEENGVRIFINSHDPENKARYYFWTYEETWKYKSKSYSIYKYEDGVVVPRERSDELYFCWKTLGSNKLSIFSTESLSSDVVSQYSLLSVPYTSRKLYFEYSIKVNQHIVTEEAYQYWVTTIKNSENMGSIYSPIPSKVIGNIHSVSNPDEPVIGYFSVCSVESNRVSISRDEVPSPVTYEPDGYENCGEFFIPVGSESSLSAVLIVDKKFNEATQALTGYSVGNRDCVDCREKGGTLIRPPYWN